MKKLSLACLALCFAGLSAVAVAGPNADPNASPGVMPDSAKGNQGCFLILFPPYSYANPGKALQTIREQGAAFTGGDEGPNPADWYDYIVSTGNPFGYDNIGEFVNGRCGPQY